IEPVAQVERAASGLARGECRDPQSQPLAPPDHAGYRQRAVLQLLRYLGVAPGDEPAAPIDERLDREGGANVDHAFLVDESLLVAAVDTRHRPVRLRAQQVLGKTPGA